MTESSCACHGDTKRAERDRAYRTAPMIGVGFDFGFGATEHGGGFLASSQSLKADWLDFLGDGSISMRGLLAWSVRARVALSQGVFLGVLGSV